MNLKGTIIVIALCVVARFGFAQQHHREETIGFGSDPIKTAQVYPNPAVEFLNIRFETAQAKHIKLSVHNILGNTLEVEKEVVDEYEIKLKVKDLADGYYFISVRDERANQRGTYKFLKK